MGQNADEYTNLLNYMNNNNNVFLGWTAWGAGEWWPPSYHYYLGNLDGSGTNILDDFFNPDPSCVIAQCYRQMNATIVYLI